MIILNGPSCSGKSSIQKSFQKLMLNNNKSWIKLGIDNLFDKPFPDIVLENLNFWKAKNNLRWIENIFDSFDDPIISLKIGVDGEKIMYGMNSAIAAYAEIGNDIIVDYIVYDEKYKTDLDKKLKNIHHYWIKVNISLEEIEKRELMRNTSPKGHARSIYNFVHNNINYDLVVDSEKNSPEEIAQQIKVFIEKK